MIILHKSLGSALITAPQGRYVWREGGTFLRCIPTYKMFSYAPYPHANAGKVVVVSESFPSYGQLVWSDLPKATSHRTVAWLWLGAVHVRCMVCNPCGHSQRLWCDGHTCFGLQMPHQPRADPSSTCFLLSSGGNLGLGSWKPSRVC